MAKLSKWAIFVRVFLVTLIAGQGARIGAQSADETNAWANATSQNTPAAYYRYLAEFPSGAFVEQAISALVGLGAIDGDSPGRQLPSVGGGGGQQTGGGVYQ